MKEILSWAPQKIYGFWIKDSRKGLPIHPHFLALVDTLLRKQREHETIANNLKNKQIKPLASGVQVMAHFKFQVDMNFLNKKRREKNKWQIKKTKIIGNKW